MIHAPWPGVILGMTTLPAVSPGEPVCHLGRLPDDHEPPPSDAADQRDDDLQERTLDDLATNVMVVDRKEKPNAAS